MKTSNAGTERAIASSNDSWRAMVVRDWHRFWPVYLMILPVLAFYILWCYGPMYGILLAFKDYAPRKGIIGSSWAGIRYFVEFFKSPYAFRVVRNTIMINFWNLVIGFPLPIVFALLLNEVRSTGYKRTVQTITYMPHFISTVILCGMLIDFTASDGIFGVITKMMGGNPTNLLSRPEYFRPIYVGSDVWQKLGWDSIIFLSALTSINPELYEAATIDGCGAFKRAVHVSIPGILPTMAILLILRVGSMMSLGFEKIILLYNGLTYETADVISSYVYRKGIEENNFSFSTAVGLFNSVINCILVIGANRISARLTETSLW
ncbi:ABC transporter permease subunit [Eubacteriales bacterium mix99]|jgi:putative aldouronate transport system permease protein|nr:sugar ABC transporter permease [Clostridiales bacterium]